MGARALQFSRGRAGRGSNRRVARKGEVEKGGLGGGGCLEESVAVAAAGKGEGGAHPTPAAGKR